VAVSLRHEHDNVFRMDISGLLMEREFAAVQQSLVPELQGARRIRLLVTLTGFEGWDPHAHWRDLAFYIQHGGAIERIAIVGDDRWRAQALMFAAADLRDAPVEYFGSPHAAQARAWLSH
jgi:hypothetical protein